MINEKMKFQALSNQAVIIDGIKSYKSYKSQRKLYSFLQKASREIFFGLLNPVYPKILIQS